MAGYFKLRGMAVPRRLKASRWVLVGSVSIAMVTGLDTGELAYSTVADSLLGSA